MRRIINYLSSRSRFYWILLIITAVINAYIFKHDSLRFYIASLLCGFALSYVEDFFKQNG